MASVATFDPGLVTLVWAGHLFTGFADGEFIQIERAEEIIMQEAGAQGDVVQIRNRNKTGKCTVRLLQSSSSNDFLTAAANRDELTGDAVGPLVLTDLGGRTVVTATNARISKHPVASFGKEGTVREWEFALPIVEMGIRGNGTI